MTNLTDKEKQLLIQIIDAANLQGTPDQLRLILEMIDGVKAKLTAVDEVSETAVSNGYKIEGVKSAKFETAVVNE